MRSELMREIQESNSKNKNGVGHSCDNERPHESANFTDNLKPNLSPSDVLLTSVQEDMSPLEEGKEGVKDIINDEMEGGSPVVETPLYSTEHKNSHEPNRKAASVSPTKRKKNKCTNRTCIGAFANICVQVKSLEKEKSGLSQKVENLEKHQETLRATIAAQKSLISEQQLSTQVHNNLASMLLDEIVDDGESVTIEEQANRVSQLKEIHNVNNDLQRQVKELEETNKQLKEHADGMEDSEKWNVSRIKSLETALSELEKTRESLTTIVDSNRGLLTDLNNQIKEKDMVINELNGKLQDLNNVIAAFQKSSGDMTSENELQDIDKPSYELEVNIAYLEKKTQDQDHQLFLAQEELVKMREAWDADKMRMLDYENKYCQTQIAMKELAGKLQAAEAQLSLNRSLRGLSSNAIENNQAIHHPTENSHQVAQQYQQPVESMNGGPNLDPAQAKKKQPEICVFELLVEGGCKRKNCNFSHMVLPHMREREWVDGKFAELSGKLGRCVFEMTHRGSCPKKNECSFPHINKAKKPKNGDRGICFAEMNERGSCT